MELGNKKLDIFVKTYENFRKIKAKDLWKKCLKALFETGHPWITFKDPSNIR